VTKDGGKTWTDATEAVLKAGGPLDAWVSRVFASHHDAGTAYVAKSRHRQDDFRPFLYKTTDSGATWTAIDNTLPAKPINVVFEDNKNPNLLFVGNDMGVFVSVNGGKQWHALKGNMPLAPVHDIVIHPREGDLVAGTYARGIWVTNITPLRELSEEVLNKDAHFFAVQPKGRRAEGALGNYRLYGDRPMTTPNEPNGITFTYYLKEQPKGPVSITVTDASGKTVGTLNGTSRVGINRVVWPLGGGFGRRGGGGDQGPVRPGEYVATLQVGDQKLTQKARVLPSTAGE
jgi:hypothetical protein